MNDIDGIEIKLGAVLRDTSNTHNVGVVVKIATKDSAFILAERVGDISIQTSPGCRIVSCNYSKWKRVPHDEQTFDQRYLSWIYSYSKYEDPEYFYIDGLLSLIDESFIEEDNYPIKFEEALNLVKKQLTALKDVTRLGQQAKFLAIEKAKALGLSEDDIEALKN